MSYLCPLQVTGYVVDEMASVYTFNGISALLLSMSWMLDLHWDCPSTIPQPNTCSHGLAHHDKKQGQQVTQVHMRFRCVSGLSASPCRESSGRR